MNRAGYKVVMKTSSGTETSYATPRVIQTLMHWFYRREAPSDVTFFIETTMLYASGMLAPVGTLAQVDAIRAACDWEQGPARESKNMGWLFDLVSSVSWEPTKAGRAWVRAILEMAPPVPPRSRRT